MTREEAIHVFEAWIERDEKMKDADRLENIEIYKMSIEALKEQKAHGEWIEKCTSFGGKCWAKCSVCNEFANGFGRDNGFGHDYFYPNFCPNCGADMRKEGEKE